MRAWVSKQGVVLGIGAPGTFLWVIVAALWPRMFGLGYLSYPNNLIVLNPGTGLGIGIHFLCYFWTLYRAIRWQEVWHLPTMGALTLTYGLLLLFYAYNPIMEFGLMSWLIGILAVVYVVMTCWGKRKFEREEKYGKWFGH